MNNFRNYKYPCVIFNSIASEGLVFRRTDNVFSQCFRPLVLHQSNVVYQGLCFCHSEARKMGHQQKETFLIAGLGNHDLPKTRHSVGMQLVERLREYLGIKLEKKKDCIGFVGSKELRHIHVVLVKPKLPMNLNGTSVYKTAKFYKVPTSNVYLVHDELSKSVGKISLKTAGSAGGHNGVKSVTQTFRTDSIKRLRIGIDRPASIDVVPDYVLQKFNPDEYPKVDNAINEGILKLAVDIASGRGLAPSEVFSVNENLESD